MSTTPWGRLVPRLRERSALIDVPGLGYLGLPLVLRHAETAYQVLDLDIDSSKRDQIASGDSYIRHIEHAQLRAAVDAGFEATMDAR